MLGKRYITAKMTVILTEPDIGDAMNYKISQVI